MLGFKDILEDCFIDQPINFGKAVTQVSKSLEYGVFTNTCMIEVLNRIRVPVEDTINFILPGPNQKYPKISDLIVKLELRYDMLNKPSIHEEPVLVRKRIMPLIRKDGCLYLIERLIDKQYAG